MVPSLHINYNCADMMDKLANGSITTDISKYTPVFTKCKCGSDVERRS